MKRRGAISFLLLGTCLAACGPLASNPTHWSTRAQAPAQVDEVGIALHAATLPADTITERLRLLAKRHPEMNVRPVLRTQGMFEIFSVPGVEIAQAFPEALVLPNAYRASPQRFARDTRSSCTLSRSAVQILTENLEPVLEKSTLTLREFRELRLKLDPSRVSVPLDSASVRWEVLHAPTLRTIAKLRGPNVTTTLLDPGEYQIQVSAISSESRLPCLSPSLSFALRSISALAPPGTVTMLPPLERLGVLFPHLVTVEAIPARVKTARGEGVTVAIIDTGVHYNHPDLHGQISTTAIGWNFVDGDALPFDSHGHGTQVAGLVAGVGYGIAPKAKLLPIRVINAFGGSDALSVAAGIRYASEQGARVINLSLGTDAPSASPLLEDAIRFATSRGALVVAASGNGALDGTGQNLDSHPIYPAALELPALLTVLATDLQGERTAYTHYSAKKVAMGAPGGTDQDGGLSTTSAYPTLGRLRPLMGSSASAPLVSGTAALLWSSAPQLTNIELQQILETSGTQNASLRGASRSGAFLNAYSAALRVLQDER